MKKLLLVLVFLTHFISQNYGQNKTVESARIAFITQKINLSPAQAEKFWPVYNEFQDKRSDIRKAIKQIYDDMALEPNPIEVKLKQQLDQLAQLKQKENILEKEYYNKYFLIISPKQVLDLISAEREFQKILLKKVAEN